MIVNPPFLVSYSITQKCNLKCKHCYSDSSDNYFQDELTTGQAKKLINDIATFGAKLLIFDGGEPLKREDFFELIAEANLSGIRTVIGSNATLIDIETAKKLKNAGVMAVQISVDGANAKTHDAFRGIEGSFEEALKGAKACLDAGLPFQFGATIRKGTLSELQQILELAVKTGAIAAELFDLVQVPRVKKEIPNEVLSASERKKIMEWLADQQTNYPLIIRTPGCPMYPLVLEEKHIEPMHFPANMLSRIPYFKRGCAAGVPNGYITILPNGDVIPCMLLQVKVGNIKEQSLADIWQNSDVLNNLRDKNKLKGVCGDCEHKISCAGCRGRAFEDTGDYLAQDSGCWLVEK